MAQKLTIYYELSQIIQNYFNGLRCNLRRNGDVVEEARTVLIYSVAENVVNSR